MSNKGWECPKCGKIYSPSIFECEGCNIPVPATVPSYDPNTTTATTGKQLLKENHPEQYAEMFPEESYGGLYDILMED